jgi:OOP family OmpA-OmpF porin
VAADFSATPPPVTTASVPSADTPASAAPTTPAPAPAPARTAHPSLRSCQSALTGLLSHEQIVFASGTAHIQAKSGPLLDKLAQQVRACPGTVLIEAYTDNVGKGIVNIHLSEARAAAVRTALLARGVAPTRLKTRGYGAHHPIADNGTEAGRAQNRRIEFHVIGSK